MIKSIRFSLQAALFSFVLLGVCCAQTTEQKMRAEYLSAVEKAGHLFKAGQEVGVLFVSPEKGAPRLEFVNDVFDSRRSLTLIPKKCEPFFSARLPDKKGGELKSLTAADSPFLEDLKSLAGNIPAQFSISGRAYLVEHPTNPNLFIIGHQPAIDSDSSLRGQLSGPTLPVIAEQLIVFDHESFRVANSLGLFVEKIKDQAALGFKLIGFGKFGLAFKNSNKYRLLVFDRGSFKQRDVSTVSVSIRAWARPNPTVSSLPTDNSHLSDLLVALSVASKAEWHGKYHFSVNPGLWALQ